MVSGHADGGEQPDLVDGDHGQMQARVARFAIPQAIRERLAGPLASRPGDLEDLARGRPQDDVDDALHGERQRYHQGQRDQGREKEGDLVAKRPTLARL